MIWNLQSILLLALIAVGLFFALRAMIVKKKGRCGGSSDRNGGCSGCALKETCDKYRKGY